MRTGPAGKFYEWSQSCRNTSEICYYRNTGEICDCWGCNNTNDMNSVLFSSTLSTSFSISERDWKEMGQWPDLKIQGHGVWVATWGILDKAWGMDWEVSRVFSRIPFLFAFSKSVYWTRKYLKRNRWIHSSNLQAHVTNRLHKLLSGCPKACVDELPSA